MIEMEFEFHKGVNYTLQGNADWSQEWDDIREPVAGTGEPLTVSVDLDVPLDVRNAYLLRLTVTDRP